MFVDLTDGLSSTIVTLSRRALKRNLKWPQSTVYTDFKVAASRLNGLKISPKFFNFVVGNPCQSSPSLTILVPLWFIIMSQVLSFFSVFLSFLKYYVQVSFNLKIILLMVEITYHHIPSTTYPASTTYLARSCSFSPPTVFKMSLKSLTADWQANNSFPVVFNS